MLELMPLPALSSARRAEMREERKGTKGIRVGMKREDKQMVRKRRVQQIMKELMTGKGVWIKWTFVSTTSTSFG